MMQRNRFLQCIMLAFVCLTVSPSIASAYTTSQWHALSQTQRNSAIITEANKDLNLKSGLSCKKWVIKVVRNVSGGDVIPNNQPPPNDYMWQFDPKGHAIGMSMPIKSVSPGYILQMRLKGGGPHTAIVIANDGTYVTFIESNWDNTPAIETDAYVKTRKVTYAQFTASLEKPGSFSVYFIQ